jgi:GR25 family glycosyltransferase involved in LPS biosynthesis
VEMAKSIGSGIPAIVLRTPNSDRYLPLLRSLKIEKRFEIKIVDSFMAKSYEDIKHRIDKFNPAIRNGFYGRALNASEIACAITHNIAREILSTSEVGGLIFEDDARIICLDGFYESAYNFLNSNLEKKSILNFTAFRIYIY